MAMNLPPGFVLDEPNKVNLPPGFVLDNQSQQPAEQPMTVGRFARETAGNILPNTGRLISGQAQAARPIMEDINAAGGMVNPIAPAIAAGKAAYRQFMPLVKNPQAADQIRSQMVTGVKETVKHPLNYIKENPVDAAMWASGGLGAAGAGAKAAGLSRTAQVAMKASELTNPASIALKTAGKTAELAGKAAGWTSESAAAKMISNLIRPGERTFAYGKNPIKGVLDETGVSASLPSLAKKIATAKNNVGKELEAAVNNPIHANKTADYTDIISTLDESVSKLKRLPKSNTGELTRLINAAEDLMNVHKDFTKMTPAQAIQLKRDIGYLTKWTGNKSEDDIVNTALKKAYHSVDSKLDTLVPEIKKLNERYSNLLGADIAIQHRLPVAQRNNIIPLPEIAIAGLGFGAGHSVEGLATAAAYRALSSTPARTAMAQGLNKIVSPIARGVERSGKSIYQAGKYPKFTPPEKSTPTIGSFLKNEKGGIVYRGNGEGAGKDGLDNIWGNGEYFTEDKKMANQFAAIKGGKVIESEKLKNPYIVNYNSWDNLQKSLKKINIQFRENGLTGDNFSDDLTQLAKKLGHDGIKVEGQGIEIHFNKANKFPHNEKGNIALPDKYRQTVEAINNRKNPYENQFENIKKSINAVNEQGKKLEYLMKKPPAGLNIIPKKLIKPKGAK